MTVSGSTLTGIIGTSTNHAFQFITNNTTKMHLTSTGLLGIGTTSPQELLQITNTTSPALRLDLNDTSWTVGKVIGRIDFSGNDASASGSGVRGRIEGVSSSTAGAMDIAIFTSHDGSTALNETLRITGGGRVGAGTSSPSGTLTVDNVHTGATTIFSANDNGTQVFAIPSGLTPNGGLLPRATDSVGTIAWIEPPSLSQVLSFQDDFILDVSATGWSRNIFGSGASITSDNSSVNISHIGIARLQTGTTTAGSANLSSIAAFFPASNDPTIFEAAINIPTISTGIDEYVIRIGLGDSSTGVEPQNGAYFEYKRTTSTLWQGVSANGAVYTRSTSGMSTVTTGWVLLRIVVNQSTNVQYFINGVLKQTNTTNLTTGGTMSPFIQIVKSAGTNTRLVALDYISLFQYFSAGSRI